MIGKLPLTVLILCLAGFSPLSRSQETVASQSLYELQTRFEEAVTRIAKPLNQLGASYAEALQRLLASETAAGKLDSALQVKMEIEGFGDGSDFTEESFHKRKTEHPAIPGMRTKYLTERERLWNLGKRGREELLRSYKMALTALEQEQTKLQKLEDAVEVRKVREALERDPRFNSGKPVGGAPGAFPARIHFVAKGEVELRHNGARLPYRNTSPDRNKYIDGTSSDFQASVGDILVVRMRATAVYRGLVMSVESEDGKISIPVTLDDFRYLGASSSETGLNPDLETLVKIATRPERGPSDPDMDEMWNKKAISDLSRAGSEWIKCGPGSDWHQYAVVIQNEMLRSVPSD